MTRQSVTMYKHILLAVDFSSDTDCLVKRTFDIGSEFAAKISIVHILDNIPMPDISYGTIIALNDETDNALLEQEKAKLNEIGERLNVPDEQRWLIWGSPKEEICALAEQENIDLIIVGSHGRHGLALLLGSTANDVLHHAPCDVLAVRLK
ncbi:MAG: universal stress protein [Methylococcales bacterium]|nr:universal stress protein [Methylococcales bacterium]